MFTLLLQDHNVRLANRGLPPGIGLNPKGKCGWKLSLPTSGTNMFTTKPAHLQKTHITLVVGSSKSKTSAPVNLTGLYDFFLSTRCSVRGCLNYCLILGFYTKHCFHAHNGIVEGIPIDRARQNIVDILPSRRYSSFSKNFSKEEYRQYSAWHGLSVYCPGHI